MNKCDLHTHSTASDGSLTPTQLVERAASAGVTTLALTDHDTVAGLDEAARAAVRLGIRFVPGVELSVTWHEQTIHLLGLGIDPACPQLCDGLAGLRAARHRRAEQIAQRLQRLGVEGTLEGVLASVQQGVVGRLHFARHLVACGQVTDVRAGFDRFLARGRPGYVAARWAELDTAVGWIRAAGGQAVIAHPARYRLTHSVLLRLFADFKAAGGVGLEVIASSHCHDDRLVYAQHARTQQLLASMGSDYHGPDHSLCGLGQLPALPDGCVPIWHTWPNSNGE